MKTQDHKRKGKERTTWQERRTRVEIKEEREEGDRKKGEQRRKR